jgi:hypothetical protein
LPRPIAAPCAPAQREVAANLRLDLAQLPGFAHLFAIRVLKPTGAMLWEWDGKLDTLLACEPHDITPVVAADGGGVLVRFDSSDPGLVLPVPEEFGSLSDGGVVEVELAWLEQDGLEIAPAYGLAKALEAGAAEIVHLREELAEQIRRVDLLRSKVEGESEWRRSMLRSWSWRLTAPIRLIGSMFLD